MSRLVSRTFSADDSARFARLSGDFNPLHLDPLAARRTQFGTTVVHGLHLLMFALDQTFAHAIVAGSRLQSVTCTFHAPLPTGSALDLALEEGSGPDQVRAAGSTGGRPIFSARAAFTEIADRGGQRRSPDHVWLPSAPVESPAVFAGVEGVVDVGTDRTLLRAQFPALAQADDDGWIADLLATTCIVGMRCPGLHSIYATLDLVRTPGQRERSHSMSYRVLKRDDRFRLLRMRVDGLALEGTVEAFMRATPVVQAALNSIVRRFESTAFAGQRALVVGGSRGIGEATAKLLMAGEADVTITYLHGERDAQQICKEAATAGKRCNALRFDAAALSTDFAASVLDAAPFSHVYYFASPPIERNSGPWNALLFQRLVQVYVDGFARLCHELMSRVGTPGLALFYPSTHFLSVPEKGFAEYCAAKAAGEALCAHLAMAPGIKVAFPRLPRTLTDQTSAVASSLVCDAFDVMKDALREFAAATARE